MDIDEDKGGFYISSDYKASFDSGFESLLTREDESILSWSSPTSSTTSSPAISIREESTSSFPCSPMKINFQQTNSTFNYITTPVKKQFADVSGIYYACLKSPLKSPNNYFHTDNYLHERDTSKANLLRSPAFKLNQHCNTEQPVNIIRCKNFLTPQSPVPTPAPLSSTQQKKSPVKTPTEEEFTELLFANHLKKTNPANLIGRHMGLEHVDMLNELNRRSMRNITDKILSYLEPSDYVSMHKVSKTWRDVVQQDKKHNRERIKFIRFKKKYIEATKENQTGDSQQQQQQQVRYSKRFRINSSTNALGQLDPNSLIMDDSSSIMNMSYTSNGFGVGGIGVTNVNANVTTRYFEKADELNFKIELDDKPPSPQRSHNYQSPIKENSNPSNNKFINATTDVPLISQNATIAAMSTTNLASIEKKIEEVYLFKSPYKSSKLNVMTLKSPVKSTTTTTTAATTTTTSLKPTTLLMKLTKTSNEKICCKLNKKNLKRL